MDLVMVAESTKKREREAFFHCSVGDEGNNHRIDFESTNAERISFRDH